MSVKRHWSKGSPYAFQESAFGLWSFPLYNNEYEGSSNLPKGVPSMEMHFFDTQF